MIRELFPKSLLTGSEKPTDGARVGDDVTAGDQDGDGGYLGNDDVEDRDNSLCASDASDGWEPASANERADRRRSC